MATLAELQSAFDTLSNIFRNDLTPRFNAIRRGVDAGDTFAAVGSEINAIRSEFDNAYARIFELRQQAAQITPLPTDFIARLDRSLNTNQATNNAALANVEIRARENGERQAQESRTPTGPTASSEVGADSTTNPTTPPAEAVTADGEVVTPRATTTPTTAVVTPTAVTGGDTGTNAPTRTLAQTQAPVNRPLGQGVQRDEDGNMIIEITGVGDTGDNDDIEGGAVGGVIPQGGFGSVGTGPSMVSTASGVGANDDVTDLGTIEVQARRNEAQADIVTVTPRDNVLDRFHNYTYNASVYVLSLEQFKAYQLQPKKTISGYNLLFQSAGAPTGSGVQRGAVVGRADSDIKDNRNPAFPLDYYIDSIQIEHLILGRATQAAHSVTNLKFTVVEPNNISLLDNIYRAVQDLAPEQTGQINYASAIYLMVIRFYGYDLDGRPVRVGAAAADAGQTDPDAAVEKFIPFRIKQINWTVSNQLVNYQFECVALGQIIAAATRRGTIPADIQVSGATVRDMLAGDPVYSAKQAPAATPGANTTAGRPQQTDPAESPATAAARLPAAPPKATAAGNKSASLIAGVVGAMNQRQQELKGKKIIEEADVYEIEFGPGAEKIAAATVTKIGKVAKDFTPGAVPVSQGNTSSASPDKQGMDVTGRNFSIPAGTQLLQAIDQIIRNSSYITDQALQVMAEGPNQPRDNPKSNDNAGMQWFNILMQATPIEYDPKRNDFAFRIKYLIVPYITQDFYSEYFPPPRFRGLHKRYPYWFTGENTQVLDYQATFNKLFTITVTGGPGSNPLQRFREQYSSSMRDYPFIQNQPRSTESDVGADGRANEVAANAAEYLYNPSDNAQAKVRILGDPAWIQQGSATGIANADTVSYDAFNPDGTINFDALDVLFAIEWQRPEDYSQDTGLADPYARTQTSFQDRQPIQSVIYRARKCTSYFNQGRFEQDLEGTLWWFPLPDGSNKAPATQAQVRAVDNAIDAAREQAPAAGSNRTTTFADSSGGTFNILTSSAANQTGGLGLRLPADITKPSATFSSGQFTFPDTPALVSASPALPPTSDGQDISTRAIEEADRINTEAGTDQISAEQVVNNRRLNEALSAPFARLTNNTQQVSAQPPQNIARET
jgi:hypothetical protein